MPRSRGLRTRTWASYRVCRTNPRGRRWQCSCTVASFTSSSRRERMRRTVIRLLVSSKNIFHGNGNQRRFFLPDFRTRVAAAAEFRPRRSDFGYPRLVRRTAPNSHADSGGTTPKGRAAVPGNLPWPVPIRMRAQLRRHSKSDWLTPRRKCPVRVGWRVGRIVRAMAPCSGWPRCGGGRVDVGWPQAKPVFLGQRYADPVCPPTHRRSVARLCYHRGRNSTDAAGVPSKRLAAWAAPGPPSRSRCSLSWWGRRAGWPTAAPVRLRLAGHAVAQCLRNWSMLKTSFLCSMW